MKNLAGRGHRRMPDQGGSAAEPRLPQAVSHTDWGTARQFVDDSPQDHEDRGLNGS
jgi:hypothetical protein